jgi:hypothetical protein
MNINVKEGSTQRGIVRVAACVALVYATLKGDTVMIGSIVAAQSAANGILGISVPEAGSTEGEG